MAWLFKPITDSFSSPQILHSLGSEVSLIIRGDTVLRTFDKMISKAATEEIQASGVNVVKKSQVSFDSVEDFFVELACH